MFASPSAVAAHLEPEILIVDEVLAVGDAAFQKRCLGKMKEVSVGEGRTVLFVSHNMQAVSTLTQRCVLLNKGRVHLVDKTSAVIDEYLRAGWRADRRSRFTSRRRFPTSRVSRASSSRPASRTTCR